MSLFKKKGITREEIVRQNDVKQNITKELSVCIQRLQQENHNTNEPILSTDSANAVCSVLEAVFLHNLKPSVSKTIAKYVGINQGYDNGGNNMNFWQFMERFTHSDVVAQLKRLGQVTTEIGICRAWIRVALNDCLMESYVDAMIADKKTLEYFYHSTAYLRDLEQPGIMKNYLKGLMLFQFQLSYNSSVLNSWPNQSLVLAGVINPESTPLPVIHPAKDKRQTPKSRGDEDRDRPSDSGFTPVPVYSSRSKNRSSSTDTENSAPKNSYTNKSSSYKKLRNTNTEPLSPKENQPGASDYSAHLTRNDIDEIRGMKPFIKSPSECSSSSHISHPDPVKYNINPAEYVRKKSADDVLFDTEDVDLTENGYNPDVPSPSNLQHTFVKNITEDIVSLASDDQSIQEDGPVAEATVDLDMVQEINGNSSEGKDISSDGNRLEKATEQNLTSIEDEYVLPSSYDNQSSGQCNISDVIKEDLSLSTAVKCSIEYTENSGISENTCISENIENVEERINVCSMDKVSVENSENQRDHEEFATADITSAKNSNISESLNSSSVPFEAYLSGSPLIPREVTEAENKRKLEDILSHEINVTAEGGRSTVVNNDVNSFSGDSEIEQKWKVKGTKSSSSRRERLKPTLSPTQKEMVQPDLSPAVADSILTTGREDRFSPPLLMNGHSTMRRPRSGAMSVSEGHGNDDINGMVSSPTSVSELVSSPASIGNSLSGRSGWSSSFDADRVDPAEMYNGIYQNQGRDGIPIGRPKTESFGTILQNYAPSSTVASPTLEDIIQELPDTGSYSSPPLSRDTPRHNSTSQDEYEIVSAPLAHINKDNPDKFTQHQLSLLGEIAVEKGLDSQNYQCGSCKRPIGLIYGKPRVCTYDGCYYCFECHENQEYYIPAFIVHNWDFRKHCVSKKSMQFLQDAEDQSTIDISQINPKLYEHVKEMYEAKALRRQLCHLRTYLFTCKKTIADEFRKALWPKDYLYDSVHSYTLCDLLQVPSGQFAQSMKKVIKFASKHVYSCPLCSGKGHICELCYSQKVIYPFEIENTTRCPKCKSVFHKVCKTEGKSCPKCERRNRRRTLSNDSLETPEIHDYAFSPLT